MKYNDVDKSLEIKDDLKTHYLLLKFMIIITLMNSAINLYDVNKTGVGIIEAITIVLGISSLILFYLLIFKRSTLEKIPIDKIKRLKEKSYFGKKRFSLELSDGRKRHLITMKTQADVDQLRKLFTEVGIQN
ncbi:MAG: hypothetical protein ACJA2S_001771 [Cyclobacteriaceae bacterium]|jgi:hypothetical protein